MKLCKYCNTSLPDDALYCGKCGRPQNLIYCPQCGNAEKEGASFCSACGQRLSYTNPGASSSIAAPMPPPLPMAGISVPPPPPANAETMADEVQPSSQDSMIGQTPEEVHEQIEETLPLSDSTTEYVDSPVSGSTDIQTEQDKSDDVVTPTDKDNMSSDDGDKICSSENDMLQSPDLSHEDTEQAALLSPSIDISESEEQDISDEISPVSQDTQDEEIEMPKEESSHTNVINRSKEKKSINMLPFVISAVIIAFVVLIIAIVMAI